MNGFSLFDVRVCGPKEGPPLNVEEISTGLYVRFKAGEKINSFKENVPDRWRNWNLQAYGNVAQRIKNMKIRTGSYINILGEITDYEDKNKQWVQVVTITSINYSTLYIKPKTETEVEQKIEPSTPKSTNNEIINLDDDDDFFQNIQGNDHETVFC